ncbi:MAG: sulfatase-like hydrolase/transferase, partial [Acidimicrobiia bacterium]|nr:sulfatase-like hydrolase/transferase [Acidimicrobiia bacterium]MDX2466870.1 sulfatase-like hydrolase/transferase [Acidimicrobiia bacterium]
YGEQTNGPAMTSEPVADTTSLDPPAESSAPVVLWFVPLLGVILTPGLLWIVEEQPMAARVELALAMTAVVLLVAILLLAVVSAGFRRRIRWSTAVATIAVLVTFQWPTLTYAGRALETSLPIPFLVDVFPVAIAVAFLWVAIRLGGEWPFVAITGFGVWLIVVVLAASTLSYVDRSTPTPPAAVAPDGQPDVMVIVLDAYTRADTLQSHFGFDNTPLLRELEQLGFQIATAANSNYSFTYASIASILDLSYVFQAGPVTGDQHEAMRNALGGNGALPRYFRESGYEIAYLENAWGGSHCGAAVDICIRDGFVERTLWNSGQVTILAPLLSATRPHPFNTVSLEHLESLPDYLSAERTNGVPRLTFAHIILPHQPFLLDAQCEQHNTAVRRALTVRPEWLAERSVYYAAQLACTNTKLVESLKQIIAGRPDTVIMITGDHGSMSTRTANEPVEDWSDEEVAERMSILSAYRLPGCESLLYSSITPVNGARAMTSCALGLDIGTVADTALWAPHNGRGIVTDVTNRLDD